MADQINESYDSCRNMIFVSHAGEDFEFTKWLALQLAKEGYGVWCDLTKLLGGENWPSEINKALQNRTSKFLFVLSRFSNTKSDPLGELETTRKIMRREQIANFIIPLKIDDISRDIVDYRLQEIQSISFETGWANGLSDLLKLLRKDNIPKHVSFNPSTVNEWWKKYGTDACKIIDVPEKLYSNRFPILSYPGSIQAHFVNEEPRLEGYIKIKYPILPFKKFILSLADADHLQNERGIKSKILESHSIPINDILAGTDQLIKDSRTGDYYFTRLLNLSFEKGIETRGLRSFRLSKGYCYYFHEGILNDGRIKYSSAGELNSKIKLWGKFKDENWYWAIHVQAEREPNLNYAIRIHILVGGKRGLRAAPKAVFKSWRNDKWRDRLAASVVHLAEDGADISLSVGANEDVIISREPIPYISPLSYEEPKEQIDKSDMIIDD